MATDASSSCENRITLALNHMKNVQLGHHAEKGEFDKNHPGLVAVGREMFRLERLEQIASEKASTLHFIDEIEVYLAYQNKLKEHLALTSVTKEMRFFDVANVTESDLQSAKIQVQTAEDKYFMKWILQWTPLHSMLSDTELKPTGLLGNDDAVRTIGVRAIESAEKAF